MKPSHLHSLLFIGLSAVAGSASAAITGPVTIDFVDTFTTAVYGKSDLDPSSSSGCLVKGCYTEDGASIGSVLDPNNDGAHLHRFGPSSNRSLEYHNDSTGIYVRATDLSAFSMISFTADTRNPIDPSTGEGSNPGAGTPSSYYEVLGFNSALNDNLATFNWTADPTYNGNRVAYQTVANAGSIDTISLNEQFNNVSAVWIHYVGYPVVPSASDTVAWNIKIDAIQLSAPVTVPVPAAVYLFGTGLMGFLAIGKRRRSI